MSLQVERVQTVKGLVWLGVSWLFISSVPPAPNPLVTIALYAVAQVAMLYWVLKPLLGRSRHAKGFGSCYARPHG